MHKALLRFSRREMNKRSGGLEIAGSTARFRVERPKISIVALF
jgi:hypothetical protein